MGGTGAAGVEAGLGVEAASELISAELGMCVRLSLCRFLSPAAQFDSLVTCQRIASKVAHSMKCCCVAWLPLAALQRGTVADCVDESSMVSETVTCLP